MDSELKIWEYNWYRIQNILQKLQTEAEPIRPEIELIAGSQSFTNPGSWGAGVGGGGGGLSLQFKTKNHTTSYKELGKMGYAIFKEPSNIVLGYRTFYPSG